MLQGMTYRVPKGATEAVVDLEEIALFTALRTLELDLDFNEISSTDAIRLRLSDRFAGQGSQDNSLACRPCLLLKHAKCHLLFSRIQIRDGSNILFQCFPRWSMALTALTSQFLLCLLLPKPSEERHQIYLCSRLQLVLAINGVASPSRLTQCSKSGCGVFQSVQNISATATSCSLGSFHWRFCCHPKNLLLPNLRRSSPVLT